METKSKQAPVAGRKSAAQVAMLIVVILLLLTLSTPTASAAERPALAGDFRFQDGLIEPQPAPDDLMAQSAASSASARPSLRPTVRHRISR
jgi:hypothetical protein